MAALDVKTLSDIFIRPIYLIHCRRESVTKERVYELLENAKASIQVEIDDIIIARCSIEAEKIGVPVEDYISALVVQNMRLNIAQDSRAT
jgi:hypothetical protein